MLGGDESTDDMQCAYDFCGTRIPSAFGVSILVTQYSIDSEERSTLGSMVTDGKKCRICNCTLCYVK